MKITAANQATIGLSWMAIAATLTIAYGFGYPRLSMVSLGYTYRDIMKTSSLHVSNMGWDNDNFLESLGQGPDAIDKANEEYHKLKEFGNPAESLSTESLSKEQIERIKQQNEQEGGSGGQMFKQLLERAKQQKQESIPTYSPPPPSQVAMPPQDSPPSAAEQPSSSLPAGFETMSVEAQAALFRELLNNKEPAERTTKGTYSPKGIGPDGRKIGRNRDADAIVNSADVYFAQLKLDSSVRSQARMQGDPEFADKVFADPRIQDIKLHVNPHMEEQRKKEAAMLETAQEEMIIMPNANEAPINKADTGVSYKEKLRAKKQGSHPEQNSFNEPRQVHTEQQQMYTEAPTQQQQEVPLQQQPLQVERQSEPVDQRQQIRTLMGLLLKHRGGPGFGSGRLQGAEIERFDELSERVLEQLQQEAVPSVAEPQQVNTATPQYSQPLNPSTTNSLAPEEMNKMIAAVEGALQLYKNSPPELQVSLVGTIQATLVTAANTCNRVLENSQQQDFPQVPDSQGTLTSAAEQMNQMIGAVEGAFQLYKNSPPALQASLVGILQTTLMAAINTCNQILDSGRNSRSLESSTYTDVEPEVSQSSVAAPKEPSIPVMENTRSSAPRYDGSDENSQFFENVYQKLQAAASSDGKLGLRPDISPADASALVDDLTKMRALLVEELEHGIPSGSSSTSGAGQKYEEMLARARSENGNQ